MNFDEAEKYLLSLGNEVSAMKLGLKNTRKLLAALGNPHEKYLKVQIAGTNGKGSVCAFLNSICLQAGIRTGMYTSPHLVSITERIKIDGVDISEDDFAKFATRVRDTSEILVADGAIEGIPTYFEQVTAIALVAFAEAKVELAILETGLGGRLDATTAANAEIAAITRIDLDHQQYLGETIEEVAAEKAAIIHEGSRVVVGEQKPEAMEMIVERCREMGVRPNVTSGEEGRNTSGSECARLQLGLAGRHQIENAAIAIAVADIIRDHFVISNDQVVQGLGSARHPGRLEWIGRFLLDGAHNIGGARALRTYLDEFVDRPITMIFGAMSDKDVKDIAAILWLGADKLILTRPDNSRALSTNDLLKIVPMDFESGRVFVMPSAADALTKGCEVSEEGWVIVVTGSLHLVGEARGILTGVTR